MVNLSGTIWNCRCQATRRQHNQSSLTHFTRIGINIISLPHSVLSRKAITTVFANQLLLALHTAHCTLHTAHYTLHITHYTLHTAHCTLHTKHCTLQTALLYTVLISSYWHTWQTEDGHTKQQTLHTTFTLQVHTINTIPTHSKMHTTNCIFHTVQKPLHTTHCKLRTARYTLYT